MEVSVQKIFVSEVTLSDRKLSITINGIETMCDRDDTILKVAKKIGVRIPHLCHDKRLEPYGGCRLCIVKVKGIPRPLSACTTPVANNMEVTTDTDDNQKNKKNSDRASSLQPPK